jgi:hypothetical protein
MVSGTDEHDYGASTPTRGDIYSRRREGRVEWWRVSYLLTKGRETYVLLCRVDNARDQTIATLRELADSNRFERVQAHFRDPRDDEKPS